MKKLLLASAAIAMALPAFSAKWAVVGAYTDPNWNFAASTVLEGEGDVLTCEIAKLTTDFKIVDIENNNWDTQYGSATPLVIGETLQLEGKNNGQDPANIKFGGNVLVANNAKVTFNAADYTLLVESTDLEKGFPELYVTGSFCAWATPGDKPEYLASHTAAGIYTVTFDLGDAEKTEFKLAGAGWSNEIAGGVEVTADAAAQVTMGGQNLYTTLTGTQTLTFDINTMKMTFGNPELLNGSDSVESIEAAEVPAEYYNLQGVRVNNPAAGLYIVKQGRKVSKTLIR